MARRRGAAAALAAALSSPALVAAVSVMALGYYSTVFVFLDHWLGLGTTAGAAHAAAFSLIVAACLFSFLCAAAADPGSVPAAFSPDAEDPQVQVPPSQISLAFSQALLLFFFLGI
jgi:palmitoyltransferase